MSLFKIFFICYRTVSYTHLDVYKRQEEQWNEAQDTMEKILEDLNIDYKVGVGEAAFYGPKLDIQIKNVHGKEDTVVRCV